MIRKIIKIDEEKCNGCGACASACHEGAIEMIGGKARLTREDYCDGLGDCLPACKLCLTVYHLYRTLVAGGGTGSAAITFIPVNFYNFSYH